MAHINSIMGKSEKKKKNTGDLGVSEIALCHILSDAA